jgi:hypothetical protein
VAQQHEGSVLNCRAHQTWPPAHLAFSRACCAVAILLELRDSITNWPEFAAANRISGWNNRVPVCVWGGVTCSEEGRVQTL